MTETVIGQSAGKTGKPLSVEFVAGLVTGEGCFCLSVRQATTKKGTRILAITPYFIIAMKDVETLDLVSETFDTEGIGHYRIKPRKQDGVLQIQVNGLKRTRTLLNWMLPHLTGAKRASAQNMAEYIDYRLALPHKTPVGQTDLDYLWKARSLNGNQGQKFRAIPMEHLSRILRDSTPGSRNGEMRESALTTKA